MTATIQTTNKADVSNAAKLPNPWILLAIATILSAFTRAKGIPAAFILSMLLYVNFDLGEKKKFLTFLGIVLSGTIGGAIAWYGMIPGGIIVSALVNFICWIFLSFAILYARYIQKKLPGFVSTLTLPSLIAFIEFAEASVHPFGAWPSIAYIFLDFPHLQQIASIFGIWGITFVVIWSISIISWILNHLSEAGKVKTGILALGLIWSLISLYGAGRFVFNKTPEPTVRIGGVTYDKMEGFTEIEDYVYSAGKEMIKDLPAVKAKTQAINDKLFEHTENLARAGAKIIYWDETSGLVFDSDENAFYERGKQLAEKYDVYIGIKALIFFEKPRADLKLLRNVVALITPEGEILGRYAKSFPVPGFEDSVSIKGDQKLPILKTEYGILTHAICYDADFSRLIRQAGQNDAGIIFVPSGDWKDIDPYHVKMSSYRAIENGATLVHVASGGASMAFNYRGETLGSFDYFGNAKADNYEFIFEVPIKHHFTLYSVIGDVLPILCAAFVIALTSAVLYKQRKRL